IPATRCSRWCSTASAIEVRSRTRTLRTLTTNPWAAAASSNAASSDVGPKSVEFCATTPRCWDFPVARARAARLGRYPSCSMAARTRNRVRSRTLGCPLSTRETVWCETPASRATSVIAGSRPPRRTAEISSNRILLACCNAPASRTAIRLCDRRSKPHGAEGSASPGLTVSTSHPRQNNDDHHWVCANSIFSPRHMSSIRNRAFRRLTPFMLALTIECSVILVTHSIVRSGHSERRTVSHEEASWSRGSDRAGCGDCLWLERIVHHGRRNHHFGLLPGRCRERLAHRKHRVDPAGGRGRR